MPKFKNILIYSLIIFITMLIAEQGKDRMAEYNYEVKLSNHAYINGFEKEISGKDINYHSPAPDIRSALLSRASSGNTPPSGCPTGKPLSVVVSAT